MDTTIKPNALNVLDVVVKDAKNQDKKLSDYKGNVLLIVNVASKCGFTGQYAGLEALYRQHKDQGFTVLGFPCNQFAWQEPGSMEEILTFCSTKYDVSFPIFNKIKVNGADCSPLYTKLTEAPPAGKVGWNFEKFLVGRDGAVMGRFSSKITPDNAELVRAIETELAK